MSAMDGAQRKRLSDRQDWQREYRQLAKRHDRFIKCYDEVTGQMQSYRQQAYHLEAELHHLRLQAYQDGLKMGQLEDRIEIIGTENARLKQRLADLTDKLDHSLAAKVIPDFVKARCNAHPAFAGSFIARSRITSTVQCARATTAEETVPMRNRCKRVMPLAPTKRQSPSFA